MARLIWTEPALADLESIADYIAIDKPDTATRYVQKGFAAVERLARFPTSGKVVPEIPHLPFRQVIMPPCRIFYRLEGIDVLIVFVMRGEQRLCEIDLSERNYESNRLHPTRRKRRAGDP
jgi:toxin ParE1/3/4